MSAKTLFFSLLGACCLSAPGAADQMPPSVPKVGPSHQAGYRVFIDPDTGEILAPDSERVVREPLRLSPEERNAMSTSSEGLVVVPSPVSGYMIDFQGRFQSAVFARIGPKGQIEVSHEPPGEARDSDRSTQGGQ